MKVAAVLWAMFAAFVAGIAWIIGDEGDCYPYDDDEDGPQ